MGLSWRAPARAASGGGRSHSARSGSRPSWWASLGGPAMQQCMRRRPIPTVRANPAAPHLDRPNLPPNLAAPAATPPTPPPPPPPSPAVICRAGLGGAGGGGRVCRASPSTAPTLCLPVCSDAHARKERGHNNAWGAPPPPSSASWSYPWERRPQQSPSAPPPCRPVHPDLAGHPPPQVSGQPAAPGAAAWAVSAGGCSPATPPTTPPSSVGGKRGVRR